jgi:hypothetical protein
MMLAIVSKPDKFSAKLTKLFTGCYAYHTAWVDLDAGLIYDMNLLRRRRAWPRYQSARVELYNFPQVTRAYMEDRLTHDGRVYGWRDYLLFALRPLYHLFGKSTRNAGGIICSEMCNEDAIACGVETPWLLSDAPPSPCDWARWCRSTMSPFAIIDRGQTHVF